MASSKPWRRWTLHHYHRYFGLAAAFLVIVLSVTGIMLNHTESLRLDERKVGQQWLLDLYGIPEPQLGSSYLVNGRWVMQWDGAVYLGNQALSGLRDGLVGAADFDDIWVVVTTSQVGLFSSEGELIDLFSTPFPVEQMGLDVANKIIIRGAEGLLTLDDDLTELLKVDGDRAVAWIQEHSLDAATRQEFLATFQGEGLPLERVILDLHSGRILGGAGVLLMDLAAVVLIVLALSGFYMWGRRKWRRR